jgi:hypothetical protein
MLHLLFFSLEMSNVELKQILSIVTSVVSLAWCFSAYNNVRQVEYSHMKIIFSKCKKFSNLYRVFNNIKVNMPNL